MNKLCVALLLLLSVGFPSFLRPWQNLSWISENPNIWAYGAELWWNVPAFQATLDSFGEEDDYPGVNGSAGKDLEAALTAMKTARSLHGLCMLRMIASLGVIPFSPGASFIGLFSKTSECAGYREKWKLSVDSALHAAEGSMAEAEKSISDARGSYDRLIFSGVCGSDYSGRGSENCSEIQDSFLSADNAIAEGNYGKYALALEETENLRRDLGEPEPSLSSARAIILLVWSEDGVIDSYRKIQRMAALAEMNAKSEFQALFKEASLKKAGAQSRFDDMDRKGLDVISRAPSRSHDAGSVGKRFFDLAGSLPELSQSLSESKMHFERSDRPGYLSRSLSMASDANERLAELVEMLDELETDAVRAVSEQEDETMEEISDAKAYAEERGGAKSLRYIEKAESAFTKAKNAGSIGLRFSYLSEAAALARSAKSSDAESELSQSSELSSLEDLIARAGKDGINVASEKESLGILGSLPAPVSSAKARELASSVIAKARLLFEDGLESGRREIVRKISLGGEGAADLSSDLLRIEKGLVSEGEVVFPDAIGSLAALESGYDSLGEELDAYMSEIVGNAMSVSASPLILDARLDSPSEIVLDLVLTNPTAFSTENAQVKVLLDRPLPFLFSEIAQGKEEVRGIRMSGGDRTIMLTIANVSAYETKRIILGKRQIIGRKVSDAVLAEGLGEGTALFSRVILFELDTDVGSISLPDGIKDPKIDGEAKPGPLSAGRHKLEAEGVLPDAYSQTVEKVKAYGIGLNSKVEFEVAIEPAIDLSKAVVFIDSLNGSSVSSFDAVSATGEPLKNLRRISETRFAVEFGSLRKDRRAAIRVSYLVENTEDFVERQISLLESASLSKNASDLFARAKDEAFSGNYTGALEILERSKAAQKEDEARAGKSRERFLELSRQAAGQIDALDSIISKSTLNDSFIQKLGSRKSELEKALSASNESDARALEGMDQKWLAREISALRKDLYKRYNDLKERFFLAGNSSTPAEFQAFEESLIRLETAENAEYAVHALQSLDQVSKAVEYQEKASIADKERLRQHFQAAKSSLLSSWDRYARQASAAKGTDFSGMFPETERNINSIIKEAESLIGKDPRAFSESLEKLDSTRIKLDETLASLKDQSESRISILEISSMDPARIDELREMVGNGEYVNALRSASSLLKDAKEPGDDDPALPIIGVTALAVLGAAGFYLMKPKKELRKLSAWRSPRPGEEPKNPANPGKISL